MEIKPFRAYRFDKAKVGDIGNCIAPPYDVISPAGQDQLYKKNEYNVVRITKGKTTPEDREGNNQYTRAAQYLDKWIKEGVLKQDTTDSIYAYVQDFEADGQLFQRFSFIALAKLEDFGEAVKPHEWTLEGPKIDRLNLKRATAAKFGLIFMLYDDQQNTAEKIIKKVLSDETLIDFVDEQGVRHRLFSIKGQEDIDAIAVMMRDKSCIIADGHHRYETALNYYRETNKPSAAYQMAAFSNIRHDGLTVFATHRLVYNIDGFDSKDFVEKLKEHFEVTAYGFGSSLNKTDAKGKMLKQMAANQKAGENAFGIYIGDKHLYIAVLKDTQAMEKAVPERSAAWQSLDVSVLHKLVIERLLGIDDERLAAGENIEYVKDTGKGIDDSIDKVDNGEVQIALFMNPPTVEQIQKVAEAGERMPQKSTYFYPKVYTGLTVNKL